VPLLEVVWIALLGALSGLMIGCIGIGGVILVPALVFLADIPIQIAIPAAMFAYILSGLLRQPYSLAINRSIGEWQVRSALAVRRRHSPARGRSAFSMAVCSLLASVF
jgi:uncharacterized membrane protein YfcA